MSAEGKVSQIFISPESGAPMEERRKITAISYAGLMGDRYAKGIGFWQTVKNPRDVARDVSLISSSDIAAANLEYGTNFTARDTRRQLIIDGDIKLISLIGKNFSVGEVELKGVEECTPCKRPSDLSGKPDFAKVFKNEGRAGIRAEITKGGTIFVGDDLKIKD